MAYMYNEYWIEFLFFVFNDKRTKKEIIEIIEKKVKVISATLESAHCLKTADFIKGA